MPEVGPSRCKSQSRRTGPKEWGKRQGLPGAKFVRKGREVPSDDSFRVPSQLPCEKGTSPSSQLREGSILKVMILVTLVSLKQSSQLNPSFLCKRVNEEKINCKTVHHVF